MQYYFQKLKVTSSPNLYLRMETVFVAAQYVCKHHFCEKLNLFCVNLTLRVLLLKVNIFACQHGHKRLY